MLRQTQNSLLKVQPTHLVFHICFLERELCELDFSLPPPPPPQPTPDPTISKPYTPTLYNPKPLTVYIYIYINPHEPYNPIINP